jgi:hypothetical protein
MYPQLQFHLPEAGETSCDLIQEFISIGRDTDNTIQVDHPSVSGQHAQLTASNGGFRITDRGSTNGTWVNDRRVWSEELRDGEEIRFGDLRATYRAAYVAPARGLPVDAQTNTDPPKRRKLLSAILFGCCGTALILGVLVVTLLIWFAQATKLPPDSELLLGLTTLANTKLVNDLKDGNHPAEALGRSVTALQELAHSPEIERCPPDVQKAFREYLTAMEAWKAEADKLPRSDAERLLQSILNTMSGQSDGGFDEVREAWISRAREARAAHDRLSAVVQRHKS